MIAEQKAMELDYNEVVNQVGDILGLHFGQEVFCPVKSTVTKVVQVLDEIPEEDLQALDLYYSSSNHYNYFIGPKVVSGQVCGFHFTTDKYTNQNMISVTVKNENGEYFTMDNVSEVFDNRESAEVYLNQFIMSALDIERANLFQKYLKSC